MMKYSVIDINENDVIQTDDIELAYRVRDMLRMESKYKTGIANRIQYNVWDNQDNEMI